MNHNPNGHARSAVILFADLIGGSRVSDVLAPADHLRLLNAFQETAGTEMKKLNAYPEEGPLSEIAILDGGIVGDELAMFIVLDTDSTDLAAEEQAAIIALRTAISLKISWFLHEINIRRVMSRLTPHRVAVGIHFGTVILKRRDRGSWAHQEWPPRWADESRWFAEGASINFAKRVETGSRLGSATGIAVSQSFLGICRKYGIPILVGPPLSHQAKGFEGSEPIYELVSQDIVTRLDQPFDQPLVVKPESGQESISPEPELKQILDMAFARDPERTVWVLELAIETLFSEGTSKSASDGEAARKPAAESFRMGVEIGERAKAATENPEPILFRTARCLHRLAYMNSTNENEDETDTRGYHDEISKAIRYYREAAHHERLIWAKNDLAAAYWKRAMNSAQYGENLSRIASDFELALKEAWEIIEQQPNHFYAYNLWALICASKINWQKRGSDLETTNSAKQIQRARSMLEIARHIHKKPEYLYSGTEAHLDVAQFILEHDVGLLRSAIRNLRQARKHLRERTRAPSFGGLSETIPPSDFYLPGFAVPGFQPPRPSQLQAAWELLCHRVWQLRHEEQE